MPDEFAAAPAASRSREWERLRGLLARIESRGLMALSEQELWELPSLYRKALSDLSLLRSNNANPIFAQELSQLCNKAHAVIYRGTARKRGPGLLHFIFATLPGAVRRQAGFIFSAALLMALFAAIGWVHCSNDRALAATILSPRVIGSIESNLAAAREQEDLGLAAQIPRSQRSMMAAAITANNIGVGLRAFSLGIVGGVPTLIILAFNGYFLGAVAFLYFNTAPGIQINLPLYFISGIAPHGAIELPAICLAAAAGMLIGFSWLFPGRRRRGDALRAATREAVYLLATCTLTLLVAGALEAFVTPLLPPKAIPLDIWMWLKCATGVLVLAAWLLWLATGGRRAQQTV